MTTDFDPSKHHQPDYGKDEVQSVRTGFGILLLVCFTLSPSVQFFSRVPGTGGVAYIPAFMLCVLLQFWLCSVPLDPPGGPDFISPALAVLVQFVMGAIVIVRTFILKFKGYEPEMTQFGLGILHRWMPNSDFFKIGFASDMVVGLAIASLLYFTGSPRLGSWYYFVTFCLLFIHMWLDWAERRDLERIKQAQRRAQSWNNRLNRNKGS